MITTDSETASDMMSGMIANSASGAKRVRGVSVDTRTLKKGNIFFCLKGENADGHAYADKARISGAGAIVADKSRAREWKTWSIPVIGVDDPLTALGDLACEYRKLFKTRYVAVTGSVGKTTTKELIAAALSAKYPVYKSPGNFNNLIGIPLSILSRTPSPKQSREIAVLEFGMSTPGEIKRLVEIIEPSWGVVTRIGAAHLMQLRSMQAIADAKRELFDYSSPEVVAFLNSDDPFQREWMTTWKRPTYTYGLDPAYHPDHTARDIALTASGVAFTVARQRFTLKLPGEHNVPNALAAIAVSKQLKVPYSAMAAALKRAVPAGDRSRLIRKSGITLIADCYNANPTSMAAAIRMLAQFPKAQRRIAVLGAMRELGGDTPRFHREIGLAASELDIIITVGPDARAYDGEHASVSGTWIHVDNRDDAAAIILNMIKKGDAVLFKGSHSEHLELVVEEVARWID